MGVGFITYVLHAHTHMCVLTHSLMTSHTTRNRLGWASGLEIHTYVGNHHHAMPYMKA